jgi:hypothetical protein
MSKISHRIDDGLAYHGIFLVPIIYRTIKHVQNGAPIKHQLSKEKLNVQSKKIFCSKYIALYYLDFGKLSSFYKRMKLKMVTSSYWSRKDTISE